MNMFVRIISQANRYDSSKSWKPSLFRKNSSSMKIFIAILLKRLLEWVLLNGYSDRRNRIGFGSLWGNLVWFSWNMFKEKINIIKDCCNSNSWFAAVIIFLLWIPTYFFWNKLVWGIIFLVVFLWWVWFFFNDHLKRLNKIVLALAMFLSLLFLGYIWYSFFFIKEPKIMELTQWFSLKFEDKFIWWNLSENSNYKWWNKDNVIINSSSGWITLKTSSALYQQYPIFQDLRKIDRDYLLLSKFWVPEGSRVSTQFMNTQSMNSDLYLGYHFRECVLSAFKWVVPKVGEYKKGYWSYLYERGPIGPPDFNVADIVSWNYYMLVFVSGWSFSCYIQRDWDDNYVTAVKDVKLMYSNLGWPTLSRWSNGSSYPQLLNFKLYVRK